MFEDLGRVFKQSWAAFRTELQRREPEDQVAELLTAMRRELVGARALLPKLQEEVRRAEAALAHERADLEQTERRRGLAERIGDAETVRVAEEFAGRGRERVAVLEQRLAAARAELALRTREADEMKLRLQQADANRFVLLAELRRGLTRDRMRSALDGSDGAFADWRRMEESVADREGYVRALEELDEPGPAPPKPPSAAELDERLRELKRQMGKE